MRASENRGAVLIMSMMAICLAFMMIYALIQTSGIGLRDSVSIYEREAAFMAAQSGLDYAVGRLHENPDWRGDFNKVYGSWGQPFVVEEGNGNVVGVLKGSNNSISAFRIKFNYESNSGDTYHKAVRSHFGKLEDKNSKEIPVNTGSNPKYHIKSPYVCVNNLTGVSSVLVYRADPDTGKGIKGDVINLEYGQRGDLTVSGHEYACHLSPYCVYLVVEGVAGNVLRDAKSINDVNNAINEDKVTYRRYVESYYTMTGDFLKGDVAFAEKNIDIKVASNVLVNTNIAKRTSVFGVDDDKNSVPAPGSLRSNSGIINVEGAQGGILNTFNGKLVCADTKKCVFKGDDTKYKYHNSKGELKDYTFPNTKIESESFDARKLKWNELNKADDDGDQLLSGFYQWHIASDHSQNNPSYELRYYPDGCQLDRNGRPIPIKQSNYKVAVCGNQTVGSISGNNICIGSKDKINFVAKGTRIAEPKLIMKGKLYCDGDLTISSDVEHVIDCCPSIYFSPRHTYATNTNSTNGVLESGVLTANGNINLASSVKGCGSILSTKDVTFIGNSVADLDICRMNIYANNINMKPLDVAVANPPITASVNGKLDNLSGSQFNFDKEGNRLLQFDDTVFDYLHESWLTKGNYSCPYVYDVIDMFKKFGMKTYSSMGDRSDECWENGSKVRLYSVRAKFDGGYISAQFNANGDIIFLDGDYKDDNSQVVKQMKLPKNYSTALSSDNALPSNIQKILERQQYVRYGDQYVNGMFYAVNDVNIDLGDEYMLMFKGAIRSENGNINITCRGAELTYDESYTNKLRPRSDDAELNRRMWNCW